MRRVLVATSLAVPAGALLGAAGQAVAALALGAAEAEVRDTLRAAGWRGRRAPRYELCALSAQSSYVDAGGVRRSP